MSKRTSDEEKKSSSPWQMTFGVQIRTTSCITFRTGFITHSLSGPSVLANRTKNEVTNLGQSFSNWLLPPKFPVDGLAEAALDLAQSPQQHVPDLWGIQILLSSN